MPTYELALILRTMPRPEVISTLKRAAECIFEKGGIIRQINNLGTRELPYRMSCLGTRVREGSYFVMEFDSPPTAVYELMDECSRDIDVIKSNVVKASETFKGECTVEDEFKPPAYRDDVKKMVEEARVKWRRGFTVPFKYNTGLDYYPFQK